MGVVGSVGRLLTSIDLAGSAVNVPDGSSLCEALALFPLPPAPAAVGYNAAALAMHAAKSHSRRALAFRCLPLLNFFPSL
jgi:hypothetical protein